MEGTSIGTCCFHWRTFLLFPVTSRGLHDVQQVWTYLIGQESSTVCRLAKEAPMLFHRREYVGKNIQHTDYNLILVFFNVTDKKRDYRKEWR